MRSTSASSSPLDVISDNTQSLDGNVAPSFTQHDPCSSSRIRISSCETETRPSVFMLLSDRNLLSHELTPVCMMDLWLWSLGHFTKYTPPPAYPPRHTHTHTLDNSLLHLTILLLQAYCMKPIHLFSVETWQRADM